MNFPSIILRTFSFDQTSLLEKIIVFTHIKSFSKPTEKVRLNKQMSPKRIEIDHYKGPN